MHRHSVHCELSIIKAIWSRERASASERHKVVHFGICKLVGVHHMGGFQTHQDLHLLTEFFGSRRIDHDGAVTRAHPTEQQQPKLYFWYPFAGEFIP